MLNFIEIYSVWNAIKPNYKFDLFCDAVVQVTLGPQSVFPWQC